MDACTHVQGAKDTTCLLWDSILMIWLKGEPDNNSFLFLLTDNNMWGSTLYNNLRLCQEWCVRRQMVTCVSPSPPLKTKTRRGTPILFEERGGCIQATNWLKLVACPLEKSTLKRV